MTEFVLELCFVGDEQAMMNFGDKVRQDLSGMFQGSYLHIDEKTLEDCRMVTAEVRGKGEWKDEESLTQYVESSADADLIERVYGYRIEIKRSKKDGCGCCG